MIKFDVRGSCKDNWSADYINRVKLAAEFVYRHLDIKSDVKFIMGNIRKSQVAGHCTDRRERISKIEVQVSPKYHWSMTSQGFSGLLNTIAHEFIHVKQHDSGRFTQSFNRDKWKWVRVFDDVEYITAGGNACRLIESNKLVSYRELPWEKEAFSGSIELANIILTHLNTEVEAVVEVTPKPVKVKGSKAYISIDGSTPVLISYILRSDMKKGNEIRLWGTMTAAQAAKVQPYNSKVKIMEGKPDEN